MSSLTCEVCGSASLGPILDLGKHPLCDDLVKIGSPAVNERFHQRVQMCTTCRTAIQLEQVPKEKLFRPDYHYRARLTQDVLSGMQDLVETSGRYVDFSNRRNVLDIGCNDGSLLRLFKLHTHCTTVGVDPTDAIDESPPEVDYRFKGFFDDVMVNRLQTLNIEFDLITFTNVFAHIEDLPKLCENLKKLISPKTVIIIENHYLGSVISGSQFDTFYHEHPRTYSATSFKFIAERLGMLLTSIEFPKRYGGNIRVVLSRYPESGSFVKEVLEIEGGLEQGYVELQNIFNRWKVDSRTTFSNLVERNLFVSGKALPGRAVMLISSLEIDHQEMPYIFEKPTSPKIGHYVPGTRIEILPDTEIKTVKPDLLVIWAWHILDEVQQQLKGMGLGANSWTPLPVFKQVD